MGVAAMATLAIFTFVLDALKAAASAGGWVSKLKSDDRKKFADICDEISAILKEFGEASEAHRLEIKLCARLEQSARRIRKLASGLSSEEIDSLVHELEGVCETWRRIAGEVRSSGHAAEVDLDEIARAEGEFKGLATVLRSM
jgi:hypothetical protein